MEFQLFLVANFLQSDVDDVFAIEGASQQFFRQRVFDVFLDAASQWSSPVVQSVSGFTLVDDETAGFVGEDHLFAAFLEAFEDFAKFDIDDLHQFDSSQLAEDDDFVESSEKLGFELLLQFVHQVDLHFFVGAFGVAFPECMQAHAATVSHAGGTGVGGHDDDHILEVDSPPKAVGEVSFFHDLQQHVVDVRVCLFDFVEQHDGVRTATDLLGELSTFIEADVSGRSTDQATDVVLLHVFGHVDLDEGIFIAEHEFGESFGEECFADAGGSAEEEGTGGAFGVFESTAASSYGLADLGDGLFLTDDSLVQFLLHLQQPDGVFAGESREWDSGHASDNFGDDFRIDDAVGLA